MRFMVGMITAGLLCLVIVMANLHSQDAAKIDADQKQIAEISQRLSAVESQAQNLMTIRADMRTLSVKLDRLGQVLSEAEVPTTAPANQPQLPDVAPSQSQPANAQLPAPQ